MRANLPVAAGVDEPPDTADRFPYARWGPGIAFVALLLGISAQFLFAIPVLLIAEGGLESGDELGVGASVALQTAFVGALLAASFVVASMKGAGFGEAWRRLGVRRFRPSAFVWMLAAVGAYLVIATIFASLLGTPEQEDIADDFGPIWIQVLLVVLAASFTEEVAFRGLLFGGLCTRMPTWSAALISAVVFGALHAVTGISAVPVLIAFGFVLALLYRKTGSILPGIILHLLNNSLALVVQ